MTVKRTKPTPAYEQIKRDVLTCVADSTWKQGDLIPSERELVKLFGVCRMTFSRALRELTAEQVLTRVQGSGTFVAAQKYGATLVEIRSISDEIAARGHRHSARMLTFKPSDDPCALGALGLKSGPAFHSRRALRRRLAGPVRGTLRQSARPPRLPETGFHPADDESLHGSNRTDSARRIPDFRPETGRRDAQIPADGHRRALSPPLA